MTEQPELKTCVTCKHHEEMWRETDSGPRYIGPPVFRYVGLFCRHPVNRSLITGELKPTECEVERAWSKGLNGTQCGPEGRMWIAKEGTTDA